MESRYAEAALEGVRARVAAVASMPDAPLDGQPDHMETNARYGKEGK